MRVGIFAGRDIVPGEELTFAYTSHGRGFGRRESLEPCRCEAPHCTGIIGGVPAGRPAKRVLPVPALHGCRKRRFGEMAAALEGRRTAAARDTGPQWPHAWWMCKALFFFPADLGPTPVTAGGPPARNVSPSAVEPWLVHMWPGPSEMAFARRPRSSVVCCGRPLQMGCLVRNVGRPPSNVSVVRCAGGTCIALASRRRRRGLPMAQQVPPSVRCVSSGRSVAATGAFTQKTGERHVARGGISSLGRRLHSPTTLRTSWRGGAVRRPARLYALHPDPFPGQ